MATTIELAFGFCMLMSALTGLVMWVDTRVMLPIRTKKYLSMMSRAEEESREYSVESCPFDPVSEDQVKRWIDEQKAKPAGRRDYGKHI